MTATQIDFSHVRDASDRLAGVANDTPVMTSRTANEMSAAKLFFKCENFQRVGAFKFRGAYNALASLSDERKKQGVLAFSSGNHAQAMALASQLLNISATILMPEDSPVAKLAATRAYGAQVVLYDRYTEDREVIATDLAKKQGLTLIPPFNHPDVIAGQGTAAMELMQEVSGLDVLLVCVGGGGLISGCAIAANALQPNCRVIGIEPEAGNDVQLSLAAGKIVTIDVPKTIADGAQTAAPGTLTFEIIQRLVSSIAVVSDEALIRTMRFFAERMNIVVEPTGCLAAAAALEKTIDLRGQRVGVIISGGNVSLGDFSRYLAD